MTLHGVRIVRAEPESTAKEAHRHPFRFLEQCNYRWSYSQNPSKRAAPLASLSAEGQGSVGINQCSVLISLTAQILRGCQAGFENLK